MLLECVNSVLSQSYENYEIIIIDNGSTDGTRQLANELSEKHHKIKSLHESERGLSFARNKGIFFARGKWILLLDSDNLLSGVDALFNINRATESHLNATGWISHVIFNKKTTVFAESFSKDEKITIKKFLSNSHELSIILRSDWFKKHTFPEFIGATTEFPLLVMIPAVLTHELYWTSDQFIAYEPDTEGSICNTKTSIKRAKELTRYYKLLLKNYFVLYLINSPKGFTEILVKFILYANASRGIEQDGCKLTLSEKLFSYSLFFIPAKYIRMFIDNKKGL
jgi:glycosyltransferase involved in cell wall biosynthesis